MDEIIEEMVSGWILNLLNEQIKEAEASISNERIWQNGSNSDEEVESHEFNIKCNERYIERLKEMKKGLE